MASQPSSSVTSASTSVTSPEPTKLPAEKGFDLAKYRDTKEAQALVAWVQEQWSRAKSARQKTQLQWYVNMAMFYGQQWVEKTASTAPGQFRDTLSNPRRPYYHQKKVINRTRSFVRWEMAKFLSQTPTAVSVPGSAEDQDQRASYAAEQAWVSISESKHLRAHWARAAWWMVVTGNGFLKTQWDTDCIDPVSKQPGDIKFGAITPFHLFVPDLREQEIEDQPYIIIASTKTVEWCYTYYANELDGRTLTASTNSANQILDEAYLNLASPRQPDSVTVYETWVKPGAHKSMPDGGLIISIDNILINLVHGLPYDHGQYPITKFEHIPTATFYADSPLVDLNHLNKEYNQLRSEIAEAGKRMAKPQLLAQRGSLVPQKLTNEPGLVIEYKLGYQPPTPLQLSPLPQYYLDQQDRVLLDWEDISGEKEVSRGSAPPGVTAGTAINYLQEAANQYLTPQYQSVEDGMSRVGTQTVSLFAQYVDLPRKIKTIGADGAFDTLLLSGADIASGTDIRMEPGSSIGQSQAAKEAKVMDMFSIGLIDQPMALKLLEVGGVQKVQDTLNVAEKKAQRENIKMKMLKPEDIIAAQQAQQQELMQQLAAQHPELVDDPEMLQMIQQVPAPLLVEVADFDVNPVHIDSHNKFRMSQEYELLDPAVQDQFEQHVSKHEQNEQQKKLTQFLDMIPSDGSDGGDPGAGGPQDSSVTTGGDPTGADPAASGQPVGPGATMSANGAVPDAAPSTEGAMA